MLTLAWLSLTLLSGERLERGRKCRTTSRSMIAVIQNPQLPLSRSYNFTHVQIDKIINPPE